MDPDAKQKQIQTLVKWLIIAVVAAATASYAWYAVVGLIGWAIAAGVIAVTANFAPVFGHYIANQKMKAITALENQRIKDLTEAAERNPIETMQNLYAEKCDELATAEQNTTNFETEIGNYLDVVKGLEKDFPDDAPAYRDIYNKMQEGLGLMNQELSSARAELRDFAMKIKKAKAIFAASVAANKILNMSQEAGNEAIFKKIKEEVAFDTVRSSLNRTFASLNQTIQRRKDMATTATKTLPPAEQPKVLGPAPDDIEIPKRQVNTVARK